MEHSYEEASSDDNGEVVVLKNEVDSQFLKSGSPQNFQFTGPPPFRYLNTITAAKQREVGLYPQPKILLEKLCIDTNKATTVVSSKLDDISGVRRTDGLMETGDGKTENAENGLKRKSPSSVRNKKKPYRSVARSEMQPDDGDTGSQGIVSGEAGSGLVDRVSPREETESLQNRLEADDDDDEANNNASDSCPGMSSSCLTLLKDNQASCLTTTTTTTKRDEPCRVADNFTDDVTDSDLRDAEEQSADPNRNFPSNSIASAVCDDVAVSVSETMSGQTVVNSSGRLKLSISRIHSRSRSQNDAGMDCRMSSTGDTAAAPTVTNIKRRGNRIIARYSVTRSVINDVQRLQFARKFAKPYRRQRYPAKWFDFGEKVKNYRDSVGTRCQRDKDRVVDTKESDEDYDVPPKKLHPEPSSEQLEAASTTVTRRVGYSAEVPHDRSVFADISFADDNSRSRPKPRDTAPCSKSEWDAGGVDSKDDDKISSTVVGCSNAGEAAQSSCFANRRENIFEMFRSPIETEGTAAECLNLSSRPPMEPPRVPEETAPQPRDKDPTLAAAAAAATMSSPDIKDLFGDGDSDSTECCRYEELDQLFGDNSAPPAGGQIGGGQPGGQPVTFYPEFFPFNLPSDSDDNLIVDESTECQRADSSEKVKDPTRKANHDEQQDSDEDRQLRKLRSTAYRTYTRMQRRRGRRGGGGGGGGVGTGQRLNQSAVTETASTTTTMAAADDAIFKPPENHVTRRRRMNAAKQTAMKRKPIELIINGSSDAMAIPSRRRQTLMEAVAEKKKDKNKKKRKNSRGSSSTQKAVRLLCKEFTTRSKSRTAKGLEGEEKGEGESDRFRSSDVPDHDAADVTENPERRRHHREPEVVAKSAPGDKLRVKRSRSKSKPSSSSDSRIAKKSGRPGKCRASAVKVKVKVKVPSESDPNQPPKIDILSRELGPRYNWLEQKIQAMQRGSSDDVTEAVRGGQLGPKTGTTAAAPGPDKEQPAGGRGCASDGEDGRRSNPKCSNQRSSNSSTFLSSPNSTGSPSSLRNNSTSGEWLSTARERRTTTDDNHSCTDRKDLAIGVSHDPASARTGLREVAFPTEGHPVALKEARPTSAYSAPSAPDVCLPAAAVNDCDYTASALSADPRMCADFLRGIEPRPGTTCPSLSHSDGTSHRGTPRGLGRGYASSSSSSSFVAPGELAADDGPLVLARSVSLTNLNSEDDRYYKGAGVQYHDGPVPFDLRLPKVSCNNNNNNTNNKNACKEENNSERHVETPSSNSNTTLGHVTPFPNDDWASRIALFPVAESGRWLQEDAKNTEDAGIGGGVIDPIVIDLTSEAEPRPLRPTEEEETSRPPPQASSSRSGSPPPPVLRSIKNEYERRLEMYERLSRVSKIKDQEIAILESERKRVRGELECLRNIFLKAAAGQSQATIEEAVGGTLLDAAAAAAEDFGKISEAHSRESTARLLASRTPPEAHSAKIDLNMYSYLKCQYDRERSIVDFTTSNPKGSNGSSSGVPDPGPGGISSSAMEMLSRSWSPASPFPSSSSTKVRSASPMVRPVAQQQHDPAAKVEEVRRGSDEQAWIGLPSVNDSEQLDGVPSGLVVPRHHVTSDRGKWLPVSDQIGAHRPSSSYPDSQRSSLSEAASNQSGRRHGNAAARENDVIIIGDESKRPKTADTTGRRIRVQNEAMDLSGGKSTCCIPAGTEVLNARNTPVRVNTDEDGYPVGADAALNLMKSRGPDSFHDGSQLRIGREFDGGATKVTAKQADSWKGSDENRASCISTELSELFGSEPTTVRTNGSSESSSSSNHRKPEHGFRRREERRAPAEEEEEEKEGQGPGHAVDGEKQRMKRSDRYRRGASSEQQQQQQAGPSVEPMLAPTGSGFEFASTGRSTISGLDQQPPLGRGVEGPRRASVPHPVVPEPVAPPVDRSGDLLPGTAQLRLPKQQQQQQQQQQQKMETFPSYPDRHGMSANLQDMSFMISAISKSAFPPRSSSSSSGGTNRLAEQQQKSTTHDNPARPATNEKLPAHQDVVAMTTAASAASNHGRNIIHQRDPDRGERRLLAPYPAEPPMRLYRRGVVHPGAAQLLESATGGSVPSLQRYNELHQAMNRQARQHMQQHLNGPAVVPAAGLNPRETMLAPLSTSAARSEPPAQEAAVQYRRLTGSGGAPQIPPLRHPDGRPAQQQDGFGSVSLQADVQPNRQDGLPFHSYQKGVPVPVQVRQHGFQAADLSAAHHSYINEPAQPADFNGSAFRMAPDMQRDGGAALVPCSADEGLTAPTKLLNAVALVNNILFPETPQARPPQRPVNKNGAYEPGGPGSNNPDRPEYFPVGPGIHTSNSQIARVNQDSIPGRGHGGGHRRPVDFHRRHLDPVSMMQQQQQQQQPHSMDPSKVPPPPPLPPPPVSGLRDSLRLHHSLATDRYLPTYIESISAPPQQPYRTSKTVHTSQQVPNQPPRHSTTATASRDDPSKNFQLPPPPGARPDRNPARMHPTSAGVNNNNNNDAAASLIPHNQHSFYSPPTGVLQLGFNSGNANPGVLQVERHQFRPGYEQPCNTEGFVPSPYTAGNRIHMGTNLTGVNAMTNNQPTAMATHLRHRQQQQQQQQQRTPEVIQSNRTVQMRIQATQDPNKSHQEQISSTTKAADYICDVCRKPAMFVCSACKGVAYCSTECQAVSWQTKHSAVCRQL